MGIESAHRAWSCTFESEFAVNVNVLRIARLNQLSVAYERSNASQLGRNSSQRGGGGAVQVTL